MAFADILAAITVHATAAGNAIVPPIEDVQASAGFPKGRCVRIYYIGEEDPEVMPSSVLNAELVADVIRVSAFWPLATLSEIDMAAVDVQLYTFKHELRTRLNADHTLGNNVTNVTMRNAEPGFALTSGGEIRFVDIDIVPDYTNYPLA